MKYIDAEQLKAELDKRYTEYRAKMKTEDFTYYEGMADALDLFEQYIDSLPEQLVDITSAGSGAMGTVPPKFKLDVKPAEVDLEKLGEITRHLIAVKDHEEDMRLTNDEWLLLERIGYPERFNARKEDK